MIEDLLARHEAKVLRAANAAEGSFLYEIAAAAQLTLVEVMTAVERLDGRGYLVLEQDKRFVRITPQGEKVRKEISQSMLDDQNLELGREHDAAYKWPDTIYINMSGWDLSEAIDAAISRCG